MTAHNTTTLKTADLRFGDTIIENGQELDCVVCFDQGYAYVNEAAQYVSLRHFSSLDDYQSLVILSKAELKALFAKAQEMGLI